MSSNTNSKLFNPLREEPDYLKYSYPSTFPSSHLRGGNSPLLHSDEKLKAAKKPSNEFGYPLPGPQSPTPREATAAHFFVDSTTWSAIVDHGEFDDVVVGSGFCAFAYVSEALERDPFRRILILERGGFWLPDHFQNLPLPYKIVFGGPSEIFPWQLSSQTYRSEIKLVHGTYPFFGGRSVFWSGWCPQPSKDLMRGFPEALLNAQADPIFWEKAKSLLHVTTADKIQDGIFSILQTDIDKVLKSNLSLIASATSVEPAPLAVGRTTPTSMRSFVKFSVPGPILELQDKQRQLAINKKGSPLVIATDTVVESFLTDPEYSNAVNVLKTSRGDLCFPQGNTNIILATGAIPAATILMNSVESMRERAGKRINGHSLTHIPARFPIDQARFPGFGNCTKGNFCTGHCGNNLQISATYLAGQDMASQLQYHIQITAIHSPHPKWDSVDAGRECPDYAAAVSVEQLEGSENHIVLTLGEINEHMDSWVKQNPQDTNPTTNVKVQVTLDEKSHSLWKLMDEATYEAINVLAGSRKEEIEYWHNNNNNSGWTKEKPRDVEAHVPGLNHECSTLYMGSESDPHAAVDDNYAAYGCKNVYVTGAAIFPSAGSWNPTLTMCGFAQDLARKIVQKV